MRDINILIKNNVDVESGIKLSRDLEIYNETIDHFIENIDSLMEKIDKSRTDKNLEEYANNVEILKRDAKNLGFTGLSTVAARHEINAKTKDYNYIIENYDELLMSKENATDIIKEYQESSVAKPNNNTASKKILVADDSNIVRNLIKRMMKEDYELVDAEDGQIAIDILKENSNNFIGMLLDLNMPNVNGFQVLEYLNNNNLFEKIRVAIITGDDSKETVMKAFDYPIVDVLAKPFNESDVKRVITAMLTYK